MPSVDDLVKMCRVSPGETVDLKDHDPGWAGDKSRPKEERKRIAEELLSQDVSELAEVQERLYASDKWAILIVFQAMDAAGKDSTIKHVMSGVNPQGCQVFSFKHPSAEELDHTFLWRYARCLPERGRIGIFNRSYYEDVLVVRVHPELVEGQKIPDAHVDDEFWAHRYDDINEFERHLSRNGTMILKFFLNVSRDEQRRRFLKRLDDPHKHWKFSATDMAERACWDDYRKAYEAAISATNTKWAPWYIVPADHKWVTRALVARIITDTINRLELRYPEVGEEQEQAIQAARAQLMAEGPLLEKAPKPKGKKQEKGKGKDKGKKKSKETAAKDGELLVQNQAAAAAIPKGKTRSATRASQAREASSDNLIGGDDS
jgi:PPK2 family polyphosphate:nucleotide phosphotransferase